MVNDFSYLAIFAFLSLKGVFITAGPLLTYYKAVRGGGRRRVEDMCYERRRAEACVDESAHHTLANAGGREIVGKKEGEQKGRPFSRFCP